jgi:hypothetical protein
VASDDGRQETSVSDWPTQVEQSEQTYSSDYGNEVTFSQTTWPAAPIQLVTEEPEPPGGH